MEKRARDLVPGDIVRFVTRPNRPIAEVKEGEVESQYYPYRSYKAVFVRWQGDEDFAWKKSQSDWVWVI